MTQEQFYKTAAWRRARAAYIDERLAIDGGLCEVCHEEPGLIVHHKTWLTNANCSNPDIALNRDNFRYECQTCHNREVDPAAPRPQSRITYGPNGEVLPRI